MTNYRGLSNIKAMKKTGFTLVELLVVIGVIAMLLAITLPSLLKTREHARITVCSSNINQLSLGLHVYAAEHETFPCGWIFSTILPDGGYPGSSSDWPGWWWFNYIEGFYKHNREGKNTLMCPSKNVSRPELKGNILCGNYGVNQAICKIFFHPLFQNEFFGTPLKPSDLSHPSQTFLIADAGYSVINCWHAADTPPSPLSKTAIGDTSAYIPGLRINKQRSLRPGQESDAIYGRHSNKTINIGFADGHVGREKPDSVLVEKTADGYRNLSPLWTPK